MMLFHLLVCYYITKIWSIDDLIFIVMICYSWTSFTYI